MHYIESENNLFDNQLSRCKEDDKVKLIKEQGFAKVHTAMPKIRDRWILHPCGVANKAGYWTSAVNEKGKKFIMNMVTEVEVKLVRCLIPEYDALIGHMWEGIMNAAKTNINR